MASLTTSPICILCEQPGADGYWFNPVGRWAHEECRSKFKPIESELIQEIKDKIPSSTKARALVHSVAMEYIRGQCHLSPDYTISYYTRDSMGQKGLRAYCSIDPMRAVCSCVSQKKALEYNECYTGRDSAELFNEKMRARTRSVGESFEAVKPFRLTPIPFYD